MWGTCCLKERWGLPPVRENVIDTPLRSWGAACKVRDTISGYLIVDKARGAGGHYEGGGWVLRVAGEEGVS